MVDSTRTPTDEAHVSSLNGADGAKDRDLPGLLRTLWFTVRISVRSHPALAAGGMLLIPVGWVTGSLGALWLKYFIDGAIGGQAGTVGLAASLLVLTQVLGWAAGGLGMRLQQTFHEKAGIIFEERLIRASAGMNGIEHLERPDYLDKLDPLRKEAWIVHWTLEALAETIGAVAQTALTVVLLLSVDPLLLVLPLFGVPAVWAAHTGAVRERDAQEATAEYRRRQRHLVTLGSEASPGKEIRVFGLAGELLRLSREAWRREHGVRVRTAWAGAGRIAATTLLMAIGFAGALLLVGYRVVTGAASVGDLALTFVLAQSLSGNLGLVVGMVSWLVDCLGIGARFVWLLDRADAERRTLTANPVEVPTTLVDGIALQDVTFGYPGTGIVVFDKLSLTLPAGSVVGIVGENGAGKTTLVKLLCGMYVPSSGAVLVDGIDLRKLDLTAWRQRCAGAFQDHARFELPLRQAVTIGDVARFDDSPAAAEALAAASAGDLIRTLPAGLDTQLGTTWPGGTDLSGGQWQKVALARGLMRPDPLLTVLDEPTAALDAQTEDALFARYTAAARDRRSRGGITLLISHRFSTMRTADHIIVLDAGRVVEQGSHGELMHNAGRYAELYDIQARGYR
ncbi:ABC transporter ATP-binding protein [Actinopolymorpha sp. B11F2]|uniref:ABC transporter ATP-binding protein n=1 Tax=Actinopolymorpha sp. B11F2 TaxID=3160862 RepID=UPI0032E46519